MVIYTVMPGRGEQRAQTTLHVEGAVGAGDWGRLREVALELLKGGDHLVLDLERVTEYDFSLGFFVCLLRRTARLFRKQVKVRGWKEESGCVYELAPETPGRRCSLTGAGSCCLCENLFTGSAVRSPRNGKAFPALAPRRGGHPG